MNIAIEQKSRPIDIKIGFFTIDKYFSNATKARWFNAKSKWHFKYVFAWYPPHSFLMIKKPSQKNKEGKIESLIAAITINMIV